MVIVIENRTVNFKWSLQRENVNLWKEVYFIFNLILHAQFLQFSREKKKFSLPHPLYDVKRDQMDRYTQGGPKVPPAFNKISKYKKKLILLILNQIQVQTWFSQKL